MKRFILGIGVLAVLLVGSLAVGRRMERLHDPVVRELQEAVALAAEGAGDAAVAAVKLAKKQWEESWNFLAAFADHEPMEEVDDLFSAVTAYLPDSQEFAACCQQLIQRTAAVIQDQALTWWNLL